MLKILLFISLLFISLQGCKDSFGIDNNIKKTLLTDTSTVIKQVIPKKFTADSVSFNFTEAIIGTKKFDTIGYVNWTNNSKTIKAQIDTFNLGSALTLSIDLSNLQSMDSMDLNFKYHIKTLKVQLDSIPVGGKISLNSDLTGGKWSAVIIEERPNYTLNAFTGKTSFMELNFLDNVRNQKDGYIKAGISTIIQSTLNPDQRVIFSGTLVVYYTIK